jgi:hypothetical protein
MVRGEPNCDVKSFPGHDTSWLLKTFLSARRRLASAERLVFLDNLLCYHRTGFSATSSR